MKQIAAENSPEHSARSMSHSFDSLVALLSQVIQSQWKALGSASLIEVLGPTSGLCRMDITCLEISPVGQGFLQTKARPWP